MSQLIKTLTTINEIQKVLLEDYKAVSEIWKKHNYYFVLTGGSVLGAVRHKGFIPWDDDFDVGLIRDDYSNFVNNTYKELPDYLKLFLRKKTQQHVILDSRYEINMDQANLYSLFEGKSKVAYPTLDLQIFDGTPNNKLSRFIYCLHVMLLRAKIKIGEPDKIQVQNWRPWWENAIIKVINTFSGKTNKNLDRDIQNYKSLISRYNAKDSEFIADFIGKYHFKDIYPKSWWMPVSWVPFEDTTVPIPNGYHNYLTQIYGDYMVIPKAEDRVQHTVAKEISNNN